MAEITDELMAKWFTRLFLSEGGFTDNPKDNGNWTGRKQGKGELKGTNWGISAASYPRLDIKNLTKVQAMEIYRRDFIRPLHLDRLRAGVAFQVFDFVINSGPYGAISRLQKLVGAVADGVIGDKTIAALHEQSETDLVMLLTAERIDLIRHLDLWTWAGKGLMGRIADNLRYGAEDL
jgi:lysozyme family protein